MNRVRTVVEFSVLLLLWAAAVVAAPVRIDFPLPGAIVEVETIVKGRVSDPTAHVYVLVRPSSEGKWWVQPVPAPADRDGSWQTLCYFGTTEAGLDEDYFVVAIAATSARKLREGQTLPDIPKYAVASEMIRVKRGGNNVRAEKIQIDSPHQEAQVGAREIVRGRILGPTANVNVYVLVRPVRVQLWWVQLAPASPNRDGYWETLVYFGLPGEHQAEYFELIALVTEETLKEGERFQTLPPHSRRSDIVRVRRAP